MIKGCNKRVVIIKNPGSDFFEEAYFILKERISLPKDNTASYETKMIDEANRIISDSMITKLCSSVTTRKKDTAKFSTTAVFVMGMFTSILIITLCKLVLF
ncbi:MAG: hypothetical protein IJO74_05795 [Clostridia bacterium]|nr:hypothetical protein [Clostridia bacterium]